MRMAVEVKSFLSPSVLADLQSAAGQRALYRSVLAAVAVPRRTCDGILSERLGQLVVKTERLSLLVFDEREERIAQWIP